MDDHAVKAHDRILASERKKLLRHDIVLRRDAMDASEREAASRCICSRLESLTEIAAARVMAAFWPIRSEVDLRLLLDARIMTGGTVVLPVTTEDNLIFRHWQPGCPMEKKAFGMMEPTADSPEIRPDTLLVPLVGFDRSGKRLGYGKGYYDRALVDLAVERDIMTIGVAFAMQEVASVPWEAHDRPLDMIVTEAEVIRTGR